MVGNDRKDKAHICCIRGSCITYVLMNFPEGLLQRGLGCGGSRFEGVWSYYGRVGLACMIRRF